MKISNEELQVPMEILKKFPINIPGDERQGRNKYGQRMYSEWQIARSVNAIALIVRLVNEIALIAWSVNVIALNAGSVSKIALIAFKVYRKWQTYSPPGERYYR